MCMYNVYMMGINYVAVSICACSIRVPRFVHVGVESASRKIYGVCATSMAGGCLSQRDQGSTQPVQRSQEPALRHNPCSCTQLLYSCYHIVLLLLLLLLLLLPPQLLLLLPLPTAPVHAPSL